MIKFNEETYIALTDLAKLRCAASIISQVMNLDAMRGVNQAIYAEIDRLEKAINEATPHD